jgi:hypothetical protein
MDKVRKSSTIFVSISIHELQECPKASMQFFKPHWPWWKIFQIKDGPEFVIWKFFWKLSRFFEENCVSICSSCNEGIVIIVSDVIEICSVSETKQANECTDKRTSTLCVHFMRFMQAVIFLSNLRQRVVLFRMPVILCILQLPLRRKRYLVII